MLRRLLVRLLLLSLTTTGCTVAAALRDVPGADISVIRPGAERSAVQAIVGAPLREWTTVAEIRYGVYNYDGGRPGSAADASAMLFMDVITAGLFEFFMLVGTDGFDRSGLPRQMAVAYDRSERVVGVFDDFGDFEVLPADGVSAGGPD